MTTCLISRDPPASWPVGQEAATTPGARGTQPPGPAPEGSGFLPDTWVFFATPHADWTGEDRWGLGFGPADIQGPRWSLFHCVTEGRFDTRSIFPQLNPSNRDLLRWSTSVVGPAVASLLVESVGSCIAFYCQYFAERPDLRYLGAR